MDALTGIEQATGAQPGAGSLASAGLGGQEFFELLIAQLTNQDPLEPTSNEELLRQISSIREIELSSTLTGSLQSLTDQQRFASASSLIGKFVTGQAQEGQLPVAGVVSAVRFDGDGKAVLELGDGQQLPLQNLGAVFGGEDAAQQFVGRQVTGIDDSRPNDPRVVEGIVTGVRTEDGGKVMLDLDTGEQLALGNIVAAQSPGDDAFQLDQ